MALSGRRERNRERTRAALREAVTTLMREGGLKSLNADRIADLAGVSRRTFFNYFPSVDALIAASADEVLDQVRLLLDNRSPDEPVVDSLVGAITELFTVDLLAASVEAWRAVDQSPAATRFALAGVASRTEELAHQWLHARLAALEVRADPLRELVVAATLEATLEQARRHFLAGLVGPVDDQALTDFLAVVRQAFEVVRPVVDLPSST